MIQLAKVFKVFTVYQKQENKLQPIVDPSATVKLVKAPIWGGKRSPCHT